MGVLLHEPPGWATNFSKNLVRQYLNHGAYYDNRKEQVKQKLY
jgi:hypothetical protein